MIVALGRMNWHAKLKRDLSRIDQSLRRTSKESRVALSKLELMVLVLEDRRFLGHVGVDILSVAREVIKLAAGRKYGGASTIDMQFVRTVTGYRAHTLKRKLYEALLAILIQFRYGKIDILESYLACAYFGSGLSGAEMAAQKVFGKAANELSLTEAAFVSAMLAHPRPSNAPLVWECRIRARAAYAMEVYMSRKLRLRRQSRSPLIVRPSENRVNIL